MSRLDELAGEVGALRGEMLEAGAALRTADPPPEAEREQLAERARAVFARLDELWPEVEAVPADERRELVRTWTDARMDAIFVMSGGAAPASLGLGHRLPPPR